MGIGQIIGGGLGGGSETPGGGAGPYPPGGSPGSSGGGAGGASKSWLLDPKRRKMAEALGMPYEGVFHEGGPQAFWSELLRGR